MPRKVTVKFNDGTAHTYEGVPDDATPEQVEARARQDFAGKRVVDLSAEKAAAPRKPFDRKAYEAKLIEEGRARTKANRRQLVTDLLQSTGDTVLSLGSQIFATPAAGVAGLGALLVPGVDSAGVVEKVQGWGYTPKSRAGKETAEVIGNVAGKLNVPGEWVAEKTGSPALGTIVTTGLQGGVAIADPAVRGAFGSVGASAP